MSKIIYRNGQTMVLGFDHKKVLQEKISKVCRKIHFDDSGVTWEIFDSFTEYADGRKKKVSERPFVGIKNDGSDYAATDIQKRIVYVSLMAIGLDRRFAGMMLSANLPGLNLGMPRYRKYEDKLANILIDEITHLQTGKGHKSEIYNEKFRENMRMYYEDGFSQITSITTRPTALEMIMRNLRKW